MKAEALKNFPMVELTIAALLIFFGFFLLMLFRLSLKSRRAELNQAAGLPLEEGFQSQGVHHVREQ